MDAMEDMDLLSGSNTHLSKLSSECNMLGTTTKGIFPGLKYRHLGKSGFKVSNLILGRYFNYLLGLVSQYLRIKNVLLDDLIFTACIRDLGKFKVHITRNIFAHNIAI